MYSEEPWVCAAVALAVLYVVLVTFASARHLYRCQRARGQDTVPAWVISIIAAVLMLASWVFFPVVVYPASMPLLLMMRVVERRMRPPRPAPLPRAIVTSWPALR